VTRSLPLAETKFSGPTHADRRGDGRLDHDEPDDDVDGDIERDDEDLDSEPGNCATTGDRVADASKPPIRRGRKRSPKAAAHRWTRLIHVYTSMISLLVVLFFSVTGLTLNHPEWTLGFDPSRSTVSGTLPSDWKSGDTIDWLVVSEHLRSANSVRGTLADKRADDAQGSISYKGPGYAADAFIDVTTGSYELTVDRQGLVGIMNDLHKGRDTRTSWLWLIDVSAVLLIAISATGLVLQFFIRKRRRSAFISAGVGTIVGVGLIWLAMR
jgi:uncharacterized protein